MGLNQGAETRKHVKVPVNDDLPVYHVNLPEGQTSIPTLAPHRVYFRVRLRSRLRARSRWGLSLAI
jgi:hypothetical protein